MLWSAVDAGLVTWTELHTSVSAKDLHNALDVYAARRRAEQPNDAQ